MAEWLKEWAPKKHDGLTPEDHMKKMRGVGTIGSRCFYVNPVVAVSAAALIWGFVIYAMVEQEDATEEFSKWQKWVVDVWTWMYMGSQNVWICVLIYVLYKYWGLKLGKEEDEPEFSDLTWFAMIFSCGVATGMWYYTAEGMWHYEGYGSPRWMDMQMFNMNTRAEHALMITYFHYGLHGWIPYVTIGALIAVGTYRRGWPMSMRWTLYPLIGEMCYGIVGDCVEILSILCTVFGVCTSLGLGAMQINKGLLRLDKQTYRGVHAKPDGIIGIEEDQSTQTWIILAVTILATGSVILGLKRGIKMLANVAFGMSFFVLLSVLFLDDPWYILNANTSAFGYLIWYLPKVSFHTDAWEMLGTATMGRGGAPDDEGGDAGWMGLWTVFYWGWWISWGPFVGTFLARISKGRRLGPFIVTTLILPSCWCFVFMGTLGAAQIRISNQAITATQDCALKAGNLKTSTCYTNGYCSGCTFTYGASADKTKFGWWIPQEDGAAAIWTPVYDSVTRLYNLGTEDVLFEHLQAYGGKGWAFPTTIFTLVCITLYFVTSSDSASFVVDMMAANGMTDPPLVQKVFWAFTEGAAAAALLLSSDETKPTAALNAVKALPIVLGLPYTFHLFACCQSLVIICAEEAGAIPVERKNFRNFLLFNLEPMSFVSFVAPCVPMAQCATKAWGGSAVLYHLAFGSAWCFVILLCFLGLADKAFYQMGGAAYFSFALIAGALRTSVRKYLGITGDMVTDGIVCCFWLPFTMGQMAGEDFSDVAAPPKAIEAKVADPVADKLGAPVEESNGGEAVQTI
jgi:choline-glycine betaine transporter